MKYILNYALEMLGKIIHGRETAGKEWVIKAVPVWTMGVQFQGGNVGKWCMLLGIIPPRGQGSLNTHIPVIIIIPMFIPMFIPWHLYFRSSDKSPLSLQATLAVRGHLE